MSLMRALMTAIIYFGSFLGIGVIAKTVVSRFTRRRDIDLAEVQAQAGPRRGRRQVFLLGFWRHEGPD
jgi:flagellar biosynthesis/type III secretory pathway M-ring protein FliF/YscJ